MKSRVIKLFLWCGLFTGCGLAIRPSWALWLLYSASAQTNRLYGEYRPFVYRWPHAPYGKVTDPNICSPGPPPEIDSVLYKVARAEQIQGQSGKSLQMRGRAALLACQPDVGIDIYRRAIHLDPQNASLQLELGIALALDARLQVPLQYEAALEHVLRASQKRSPEFLFDSALLFQETHLPIQAR